MLTLQRSGNWSLTTLCGNKDHYRRLPPVDIGLCNTGSWCKQ